MSSILKKNLTKLQSGETSDLKSRILFVIFAIILYRIGTYIPLPGIDPYVISEITAKHTEGVLGMLNVFSGGALGRMTIFALNVMPYITASIIMQLLVFSYKPLDELRKGGDFGRKKINQLTKYMTLFFATLQAYGIAVGLENFNSSSQDLIVISPSVFRLTTVFTLVASTLFLVWLGEQISSRGIGNGISLIIFVGIVAELPSAFVSILNLAKTGSVSLHIVLLIVIVLISLFVLIIFFERSYRKVLIQYPKRQVGARSMTNATTSFLPLKLNTAGVIPPIFASSILLFPATIFSFREKEGSISAVGRFILSNLVHGKPLFVFIFFVLIVFFCFFYTAIVFNSKETSINLKQNGGYIAGVRPGENTMLYLDKLLSRLTFLGAMYLSVVCIVPELFFSKYSLSFYLGGTSLLIMVNVAIDTLTQVQTYMLTGKYSSLLKGKKRILK